MRIVIDTNIVFSAIISPKNIISKIILQPKSSLNFYSTSKLEEELYNHWTKIQMISGLSTYELLKISNLITARITFINVELIPIIHFIRAKELTKNVDIDDTEFVALTDHITGLLWTSDKFLTRHLLKVGWSKTITTQQLLEKSKLKT